MFDQPEITLAFSWQPAEKFWSDSCCRVATDQHQIIGMDGEIWLEELNLNQVVDWLKTLRTLLSKPEEERIFLTTIVFLAWPETVAPTVEEPDRFRALALAGANLRFKHSPPYVLASQVTKEQFSRDLAEAGIIAPAAGTPQVTGLLPPIFSSDEEKEDHQMRMRFYGSPPFKWSKQSIDELYGKRP